MDGERRSDGTDAVMPFAETAAGQYPETVAAMARVCPGAAENPQHQCAQTRLGRAVRTTLKKPLP